MKHGFEINLKTLVCDFVFIIIGYVCLLIYNKYSYNGNGILFPILMSGAVTTAIIIIYLYPMRVKDENHKHIYDNKKALILFFIIEALHQITIFTLNRIFGLNNSTAQNFNKMYFLLIELGISLTIFICYFFKIRLKKFNWNLSIKSFTLVVIVYVVYKLFLNFYGISKGIIYIDNIYDINFILKFILKAILNSAYPGIFEEVLYRGFFISGLKGFGFSDDTCNIVQAIIFGISHVMSWGTTSWIFLLSTAAQAMLGYVLGKIYFKTKSLVPCILFHGLLDVV